MKVREFRKLIREEVRKELQESLVTESNIKTILGIQFKVVPAQAGMKFEFVNARKFANANPAVSVNKLVTEITKMLDAKFGKGLFSYVNPGRDATDPRINGLEFRMNANNFFKDL